MRQPSLGVSQIILSLKVAWKTCKFTESPTSFSGLKGEVVTLKGKGRTWSAKEKLKHRGWSILGARRIKRGTPCCVCTPHTPSLGHEALKWIPADMEPGWLCAHYSVQGVGAQASEWGSRTLTPLACRLPRPQHGANESNGNGWAHMGVGDYCAGPRGAGESDLRREGEETPAGSPAADPWPLQSFCKCALLLPFDDGHVWNMCIKNACRYFAFVSLMRWFARTQHYYIFHQHRHILSSTSLKCALLFI